MFKYLHLSFIKLSGEALRPERYPFNTRSGLKLTVLNHLAIKYNIRYGDRALARSSVLNRREEVRQLYGKIRFIYKLKIEKLKLFQILWKYFPPLNLPVWRSFLDGRLPALNVKYFLCVLYLELFLSSVTSVLSLCPVLYIHVLLIYMHIYII